jgi:hypothetical protein
LWRLLGVEELVDEGQGDEELVDEELEDEALH